MIQSSMINHSRIIRFITSDTVTTAVTTTIDSRIIGKQSIYSFDQIVVL